MNILKLVSWLNIAPATQQAIIKLASQIGIFVLFVLLSIILGRSTPTLISLLVRQFAPKNFTRIYENLLIPLGSLFRIAGSLILIRLSLNFLQSYQGLFKFLQFFVDLSVVISIAWLASRLFRQFILVYGIDLINKRSIWDRSW